MSVHGMKPTFTTYEEFQVWRSEWRDIYELVSNDIRQSKFKIKALQRKSQPTGALQKEHLHKRIMARKLMTVLEEANIRWTNIRNMRNGIKKQMEEFPLVIEDVRNIDFHFNKKSVEFPFIPMWVLKAKGKTFYVNHMDCQTPWTTRETPDHPSTKGSLRIKRGTIHINENGDASIT